MSCFSQELELGAKIPPDAFVKRVCLYVISQAAECKTVSKAQETKGDMAANGN